MKHINHYGLFTSLKRIIRNWYIIIILTFLVACSSCLFSKQCENYRINSITFHRVSLTTNDSSLMLENHNRNYYLLHFDFEYCNCKYKFLHTPNPYYLNGSIENINSLDILDSSSHKMIDNFKSMNLKNIFIIDDGKEHYSFCSSFIDFNELILQINTKKGYGSLNNIENDCLFYLDSNKILPQKIIVNFLSYSIECKVNNNPVRFNIEKDNDSGDPVFYNW
jgi:hypothetical protein